MARVKQGEVYRAEVAARIGFETDPRARQWVVVLQSDLLNGVLETVLVAPLVEATDERLRFPLHVRIPGRELGGLADHVAKVHLLRPFARSRLAPGPHARVSSPTIERLLAMVRRAFD